MAEVLESGVMSRGRDRVPPHNIEAEQAVLGAMLLSGDAVEGALSTLASTDFYRPAHARIFTAVNDLYNRAVPVDHLSVADRLESTGELEAAGGKPYLLDLSGAVPTTANWQRYTDIVKRMSMLRQLIGAATQIVAMGYDAPDDLDEVVEDAERLIFQVTNTRVASNFREMKELLKASFNQLEELFERKEHVTGVPTGFGNSTNCSQDCIPVTSSSSPRVLRGKDRTGAEHGGQCRQSRHVGGRVLAGDVGGAARATRSVRRGAHQLGTCARATSRKPTGTRSTSMGKLAALDYRRRHAVHLHPRGAREGAPARGRTRPYHVDYLQLMQPQNRRSENRQSDCRDLPRLKILRKNSTCRLFLSQLSRAVEQRAGKRQLSDLRIWRDRQDADIVMFLDRNMNHGRGREGCPQRGIANPSWPSTGTDLGTMLVFMERFTSSWT
jgi:replicative DNA helicase